MRDQLDAEVGGSEIGSAERPITIAYSPDSDDAFMMAGLITGKVPTDLHFQFYRDDIQILNDAAKNSQYDVTAISMAAYPSLSSNYYLLPIGASVGDGFGPAVVVKPDNQARGLKDLSGKTIAVPGLQTSAYFAAKAVLESFHPVPCYFLDIPEKVRSGEVDAGILIHELQMDPSTAGLRKLTDLGREWRENFDLPLPLGANVIHRRLGRDLCRKVGNLLKQSIEWGLNDRESTLKQAMAAAAAPIDTVAGDRYIEMYVNHDTLGISRQVTQGIEKLMATGAKFDLCSPVDVEQNLIELS